MATVVVRAVRLIGTYCEAGTGGNAVPRFEAGKYYPITDTSLRQAALDNGELADGPDWTAASKRGSLRRCSQ